MVNFKEKQGRIVIEMTGYLSMDLDNQQLEQVFEEAIIILDHPLIADTDMKIAGIPEENRYYQLCCDVINIVEDNYSDEEKKEAYEFAKEEAKRLERYDLAEGIR